MGLSCAGCCLWHEIASRGSSELPTCEHSECAGPTGGTDPGAILPTLLRSRQKVLVLCHPSPASWPNVGLWTPSTASYMAMVSSTETTASTSAAGVTHPSYPPPGMPPLKAMDTLPTPTTENLLATAGIGRGARPRSQPGKPTTPGICQMRPRTPQQQAPTPRRQEVTQATPYQQQVYPPQHTTPKPSTTPSTSQGCGELARENEGARGRSPSRGPRD